MFPKVSILSTLLLALCVASSPNASPSIALTRKFLSSGSQSMIKSDQARAQLLRHRRFAQNQQDTSSGTKIQDTGVIYTANVTVGHNTTAVLLVDTGSSNTWCAQKVCSICNTTGNTELVVYGSALFFGTETLRQVSIGSQTITQQSIAVSLFDYGISDIADGILGLGPTGLTNGTRFPDRGLIPTVTDNLFSEGVIKQAVVSAFFSPFSANGETNGELTFGLVDDSKLVGQLTYVPIANGTLAGEYWGINLLINYGEDKIMSTSAGVVDTGTTLILISNVAFKKYVDATGATMDKTSGLLRIPHSDYGKLKSLYFSVGGRLFELTPDAQVVSRRLMKSMGGDDNFLYLVVASMGDGIDSIENFKDGAKSLNDDTGGLDFILGYSFLERFYSVYDTTNQRVGLAETQHTYSVVNSVLEDSSACDGQGSSQITVPLRVGPVDGSF